LANQSKSYNFIKCFQDPLEGIGAGRIMLLSQFESSQRRSTATLSEKRNKMVAAMADSDNYSISLFPEILFK
jgi:hypothetical protein